MYYKNNHKKQTKIPVRLHALLFTVCALCAACALCALVGCRGNGGGPTGASGGVGGGENVTFNAGNMLSDLTFTSFVSADGTGGVAGSPGGADGSPTGGADGAGGTPAGGTPTGGTTTVAIPLTWAGFELHYFINGTESVYTLTPDNPNVDIPNGKPGDTVYAYADITLSDGSKRRAESDTITIENGNNKLTLYMPYNYRIIDGDEATARFAAKTGNYTSKAGLELPFYCENGSTLYVIERYTDGKGGTYKPGTRHDIKGDVTLKAHSSLIIGGSDDNAYVSGYTGTGATVTIPAKVGNKTIKSILGNAFKDNTTIKNVIIQNGVTSIGKSAFYGCSGLTSVTIPDGVTNIGEFTFYGCSGLTSLTIPNGVTSIGSSGFSGCSGLTSLSIPDGVTSIGNSAFYGCRGLTSLTIPDGVTSIGRGTFYGCRGLTSLTIPDGVTSIGESTFYGCSGLTELTMLGVTKIDRSSFYNCSRLADLTFGTTAPPEITTNGAGYLIKNLSAVRIHIPSTADVAAWNTAFSVFSTTETCFITDQ